MDQPSNRAAGQRVREILDLALEHPSGEREVFVSGACAGDAALRDEVMSLLQALDQAGDLLEPPVAAPVPPAEPLTGLRFGAYTIAERIGAGGMGVVYRAHDTRLGRTVAVKALPPGLAADGHRRARFEQEARVVASLNHPNIAAIYGVEDTPRGPVMVLEHVPGQTLAELLGRGRLPVDEALDIGRQVARGLESAHAAGVVHRDLKPANIKRTPDGVVKILDFGIAKFVAGSAGAGASRGGPGDRLDASPGSPGSPLAPHTRAGDLVGTAAYMSPEQARGRAVDRRTDLWAFGCVLFEMLSGHRTFDGPTGSDTIAAILRGEPDWGLLPADTPESVRRVLRRCLEKDADLRLRDAGDARLDLDEAAGSPVVPATERRGTTGRWMLAAGLAAVAFGAGAMLWPRRAAPGANAAVTRFSIETPPGSNLNVYRSGGCIALAPDGRTIAYVVTSGAESCRLMVRRLDALEATELPMAVSPQSPTFSPDGRWIAYASKVNGGEIWKISVQGGPPIRVGPCAPESMGCSWASDGSIVYAVVGERGLRRIGPDGGEPAVITSSEGDPRRTTHAQPEALPGGDTVLFTTIVLEADRYHLSIDAVRISTGEQRTLVEEACQPRYLAGRLLYFQAGALISAPFDPRTLTITGEARRVLSPIAGSELLPPPRYAVSASGTLAYLPSSVTYEASNLAWFGVDGSVLPVVRGAGPIESLRLSPDGARIAVSMGLVTPDVWVHDLGRGVSTRLTTEGNRYYPIWTADGRKVVFQNWIAADHHRLDWCPADGSSPPESLFTIPRPGSGYPNAFTPDGKGLVLTMNRGPGTHDDLYLLPMDGGPPRALQDTPATWDRFGARLSPDGSLIAYTSTQTGGMEVYVQPFPALDRRVQISTAGGMRATWSGDGKNLFFRWKDRLYESTITATGGELTASVPRLLLASLPEWRYDAAADGTRFIMGQTIGGSGPQTRMNVVVGWDAELRRSEAANR